MAVNLKGRSFLTLMDFTPEEIRYMLDLAHDLKAKKSRHLQSGPERKEHRSSVREDFN